MPAEAPKAKVELACVALAAALEVTEPPCPPPPPMDWRRTPWEMFPEVRKELPASAKSETLLAEPPEPPEPPMAKEAERFPEATEELTEPAAPPPPPMDCRKTAMALSPTVAMVRGASWAEEPRETDPPEPPEPPEPLVLALAPKEKVELEEEEETLLPRTAPP